MKKIILLIALILFTSTAFAITDANVRSWWKLDDTNYQALDYKNLNNGKTFGATFNYGLGILGQDYNFKDGTDRIDLNQTQWTPDKNFSMNLWIKTPNSSANRVFSDWNGTNNNGWIIDCGGTSNKPRIIMGNGTTQVVVEGTTTCDTNTWQMITVTYDGNSLKLYQNGSFVKDGTLVGTAKYQGTHKLTVGAFWNQGTGLYSQSFTGQADEVSIYDVILPSTDITSLWNGGAGITPPLTTPSTVLYRQDFNVYQNATTTHLTGITADFNVNTYDLSGQNSPFGEDVNAGSYSITFSKSGYDSNTITLVADSNKTTVVYLTPGISIYNQTFNVYKAGTSTPLNALSVDFNVNAYDLTNQTSPFNRDVNSGSYDINFSRVGFDSNTITLVADSNKTTTVYLTPSETSPPTTTPSGCTLPNAWNLTNQTITLTCADTGSRILDQNQNSTAGTLHNTVNSSIFYAQTFTPTQSNISILTLKVRKTGNPPDATLSINTTSLGKPTATVLASTTIYSSLITGTQTDYNFNLSTALTPGTKYAIVLTSAGGTGLNYIDIIGTTSGTYNDGNLLHSTDGGVNWNYDTVNHQFYFKTYYTTNASGCASTGYRLNSSGAFTNYTVPFLITDGNNKIDYNSTDNSYNTETMNTTYCAIDRGGVNFTAPVLTGFQTYFNIVNWIKGTGQISTAVSAISGVSSCQYANISGDGIYLPADLNTTHCYKDGITVIDTNAYEFRFKAYNNAGDWSLSTATNTYYGDTAPPTTDLNYTAITDTNALIQLTCTDTESGCASTTYRIDGGAWQTYTNQFSFIGGGLHTIDYNSTDNLGNVETTVNGNLALSIILNIKKPINEETLQPIDENWRFEVTGGSSQLYTDLNADKNIFLPINVLNKIRVVDMNGNYFGRNYDINFDGLQSIYYLQPYLVSTSTGILTTINAISASTNQPLQNITFDIYTDLNSIGSTLVETVVTDSKGQALVLLVLNNSYDFNAFYNGGFIKDFQITATSSTIYFIISLGDINVVQPGASGFSASWTPGANLLVSTGTQQFTQTLYNFGLDAISVTSTLKQNGVNLTGSPQTYTGSSNHTFTYNVNWNDINTGVVVSKMVVVASDGNTYTFTQNYYVSQSFGQGYNPLIGLTQGMRQDFECDANTLIPCYPLLVLAILICTAITLLVAFNFGAFNGQSLGIIFLVGIILFTYLTWIPVWIPAGLVLIILAFIVNERR